MIRWLSKIFSHKYYAPTKLGGGGHKRKVGLYFLRPPGARAIFST